MANGDNKFLKFLGVVGAIIVGIILLVYVGIPLLKFLLSALWGLSGLLAFILKIVLFIGLTIALILGIILLISWIIREFTE